MYFYKNHSAARAMAKFSSHTAKVTNRIILLASIFRRQSMFYDGCAEQFGRQSFFFVSGDLDDDMTRSDEKTTRSLALCVHS
jgi:hypothetical protein